jgi:hypothetical protein
MQQGPYLANIDAGFKTFTNKVGTGEEQYSLKKNFATEPGNALAETINGPYKTEPVHYQGPWGNMQDLELATLGRVDWFNNRRLLRPIGNIPPVEAEKNFYAQRDVLDMVA